MLCNDIFTDIKNRPPLDTDFFPLFAYITAFEKSAKKKNGKKIAIALERNDGFTAVFDTTIHGTPDYYKADKLYVERIVKFLLWMKGGYRIYICGNKSIEEYVRSEYRAGGKREFDSAFMENVYGNPFEVVFLPYSEKPKEKECSVKIGGHLKGCRIGFDAGGSDRKVSAVIDGEAVYSEEVVWHPKLNENPDYHFDGILSAFKTAASHMPRVDAIGVSSAGIYIDNRCMVASLFIKVPRDIFEKKVREIYIRAAKQIGNVPLSVCNDGDVAALAGAMELNDNNVLGIAMGTSQAAGYVDKNGCIVGWLNELAFAPVDLSENGALDEWSGDRGCGVKYFSQDAVIRLAKNADIELEDGLSPAEKLKIVQSLVKQGDSRAEKVFESIGVYLGHSLPLYQKLYNMKYVLLLGRVMSGKGGDILLQRAKEVLQSEYKDTAATLRIVTPDEKSRRVGQSVAAASLPNII